MLMISLIAITYNTNQCIILKEELLHISHNIWELIRPKIH